MNTRFEPRKRTALDGKVWWCIYDNLFHRLSTLVIHGRYPRRKDAQFAIDKTPDSEKFR